MSVDAVRRGQSPWTDAAGIIGADALVIFDVGANVGQTTLQLAEVFPGAAIYAFEPVPSSYSLLAANTVSLPHVTSFPHGFGERASSQRIFVQAGSGWNSIPKNINRGLGTVDITLRSIDELCAERGVSHINILKTDTEGYDLEVLKGARAMLSEGRVDAIYSEVGFYRDDVGHTYFCSLLEYLQRVDFQFFGLYGPEGLKYLAHETEPCYPWANALFLRNGLVQAKYGYDYAQWLAGFARP